MNVNIPTLHTERLIMRGLTQEDFGPMADFFADPVSRFYGGPCDRDDAWRKFAAYLGHWVLRGYGPWGLEVQATGQFVGITGLWYPEGWIEPEITWALVPGCHGQGFATEAAARAVQSAYDDFGWSTAASVISVDNEASLAVARRVGATHEATVTYRYGPAHLYRHRPPTGVQPLMTRDSEIA